MRTRNAEDQLQPVGGEAGQRGGEENREPNANEAPVAGGEPGDNQHQPDRGRREAVREEIEYEKDPLEESGPDQRTRELDEIDSHSASAHQRVKAVARGAVLRRGR